MQEPRELRAGRRLARPLQPRHQDDRGGPRRHGECRLGSVIAVLASQQRGQLLGHDLDHLLTGVQRPDHIGALAALAQRGRELAHDLEVHVGLEQRQADRAQGRVYVLLAERAAVANIRERALQLLGQRLEHRGLAAPRRRRRRRRLAAAARGKPRPRAGSAPRRCRRRPRRTRRARRRPCSHRLLRAGAASAGIRS